MKVREGDNRSLSDDTESFAIDLFTGDSALPLFRMSFPAASEGGNLQDGKSCRLASRKFIKEDRLSGTWFCKKLCEARLLSFNLDLWSNVLMASTDRLSLGFLLSSNIWLSLSRKAAEAVLPCGLFCLS